jgi:arylsulfatase A-like enzyme
MVAAPARWRRCVWALLAACRPTVDAPPERPNLIVVDIDSWRADRVGQLRDGVSLTPQIDSLVGRGTRFDFMVSQSGWTIPALSSLLTGRLPRNSLANEPADAMVWMEPSRTVGEILSLYGYQTIVFYGGSPMSHNPEFTRGFALAPDGSKQPTGDGAVVAWLRSRPKRPWFALVHDLDLHQLPEFRRADVDRFAPAHPPPCVGRTLDDPDYERVSASWASVLGPERARELMIAHYDGALTRADAEVGTILDALREQGDAEHTVIVVTSNHGEELYEHGAFTHARPYEAELRVPLVVADLRTVSPPRRVPALVQTIDLAPTLLELAGVPIDREMEGRSLVPLLLGHEGYAERPALSVSDAFRTSLRTRGEHLVRCGVPTCEPVGRDRALDDVVYALYEPATDPNETTDVSQAKPELAAALRQALDAFVRSGPSRDEAVPPVPEPFVEVLRERGYWNATPAPTE